MFLHSGSYVDRILGVTAKSKPLNIERQQNVFEIVVWLHCVVVVCNEVEEKTLSLKLNYLPWNTLALVVYRVCSARTKMVEIIGSQALSA